MTKEELREIERLINAKIREDVPVKAYELSFQEVQKKKEIKQFFGEKYGDTVRVIDIDFSKELCGGTHTSRTGTIGFFKISKESSIAAGVRRIEAVCGLGAEKLCESYEDQLASIAELLKTPQSKIEERIQSQVETIEELQEKIQELKLSQMKGQVESLKKKAKKIGSTQFIAEIIEIDPQDFHLFADQLIENMDTSLIALGMKMGKKCQIALRITPDLVATGLDANQLIKDISPLIQGGGGGKKHSAQAGGKNGSGLPDAFEVIEKSLLES